MQDIAHPLRILIVDDDEDTVTSCEGLLKLYGYEVRTAQSASEALDLLDDWEPDIALLDIRMPKMDGCELARLLTQICQYRPLLVAVTATNTALHREQAQDAGFDHYFVKPVNPDAMVGLLRQYTDTLTSRQRA